MIGICPRCGNYAWDKRVTGTTIECPKCGHTWPFRKLPLFLLSGCSGVGKTTTAQAIMQRAVDFVVLDGDMFHSLLPTETEKIEQMLSLSRNIAQSGHPVLWAKAGGLDLFGGTYNRQFFTDIHCLALVCEESELRRRMTEGRGITEAAWLDSSTEYNRYFMTHDHLADMPFETLDITGKAPEEVASRVIDWVQARWRQA